MKYTLLDLVQTVLSSTDGDAVNSINDSVESTQVAKIIRTVYFDIINRANLPKNYSLITLDASGDSTKPVLMTIPDTVEDIKWLKYDNATATATDINMQEVTFLPLSEFLDRMDNLKESDSNVETFTHTLGADTYTFLYTNDNPPQYYTSFDNVTLIFDSYDSDVDATLQKSKSRAYARLVVPFTMSDTFTPDLDEIQFGLLLNESKSLAWAELKQSPHPKAEQNSKRHWSHLQSNKVATDKLSDFEQLPNFGRR